MQNALFVILEFILGAFSGFSKFEIACLSCYTRGIMQQIFFCELGTTIEETIIRLIKRDATRISWEVSDAKLPSKIENTTHYHGVGN